MTIESVVVGMKDAGRSWTEISADTGLSVFEAKRIVTAAKKERRNELAHSLRNETARGLTTLCQTSDYDYPNGWWSCDHPLSEHVDGVCQKSGCQCEEFLENREAITFWSAYPNDVGSRSRRLGVPERVVGVQARRATRLRRAVKKLRKMGKDAP